LIDEVIEKLIVKHKVYKKEVEEVFENKTYVQFVEKGHRKNENLYLALGKTNNGRHLIVFFIYKGNHQILPISCRDMDNKEKRFYGKK